jgi:hypothetical protein
MTERPSKIIPENAHEEIASGPAFIDVSRYTPVHVLRYVKTPKGVHGHVCHEIITQRMKSRMRKKIMPSAPPTSPFLRSPDGKKNRKNASMVISFIWN